MTTDPTKKTRDLWRELDTAAGPLSDVFGTAADAPMTELFRTLTKRDEARRIEDEFDGIAQAIERDCIARIEDEERARLRVREEWERQRQAAEPPAAAVAHQEPRKQRGRKPSDAPALLARILDALESYTAGTGQDFDRYAMPGPLGESADDAGSFHWLCARIYPRTFKRAPDTFAKHRAGLCAVAPYAKPTDFYRLALPHIAPKLGVTLNVHHMPKQGRKLA